MLPLPPLVPSRFLGAPAPAALRVGRIISQTMLHQHKNSAAPSAAVTRVQQENAAYTNLTGVNEPRTKTTRLHLLMIACC